MSTPQNYAERQEFPSEHEAYPLQPMLQASEYDVSEEELESPLPNEPHLTRAQSVHSTASGVENLGYAQRPDNLSSRETYNMPLPSLPVSTNASGPGNTVVSALTATSQPSPKKDSAWTSWLRFWRSGWTADGFGCAIAALALMAICIILRVHANNPLPEWPYSITINALIAIFTVVLKAGVALPLAEGWFIGTVTFESRLIWSNIRHWSVKMAGFPKQPKASYWHGRLRLGKSRRLGLWPVSFQDWTDQVPSHLETVLEAATDLVPLAEAVRILSLMEMTHTCSFSSAIFGII